MNWFSFPSEIIKGVIIMRFLFKNSLSVFDGMAILTVGTIANAFGLAWMLLLIPTIIVSAFLSRRYEFEG